MLAKTVVCRSHRAVRTWLGGKLSCFLVPVSDTLAIVRPSGGEGSWFVRVDGWILACSRIVARVVLCIDDRGRADAFLC